MATDNSLGDCWQTSVGKGIEGTVRKYFRNSKYILGTFSFPRPASQVGSVFATSMLSSACLTECSLGTQQGWQEQVYVACPSGISIGHRTQGWWPAQRWLSARDHWDKSSREKSRQKCEEWHWKKGAQDWVMRFKTLKSLPLYIYCLGKVLWG